MCNRIPEKIKIAKVDGPNATSKRGTSSVNANDSKIFWIENNKKPINKHIKIFILFESLLSVPSRNIAAINNIAVKNIGLDNSVRKKSLCLEAVYPDVSNLEINSLIE